MTKAVELLAWIGCRVRKPPSWQRLVWWLAPPQGAAPCRTFGVVRDGVIFIAQPAVPLGWHVAFFGTYDPELRVILRTVLSAGTLG